MCKWQGQGPAHYLAFTHAATVPETGGGHPIRLPLSLPLNATSIFILDPYEKCAANSQHWNTANVLDLDSDCLVGIHTRESELFLSYATSQIDCLNQHASWVSDRYESDLN
jgi:hypothetical protein